MSLIFIYRSDFSYDKLMFVITVYRRRGDIGMPSLGANGPNGSKSTLAILISLRFCYSVLITNVASIKKTRFTCW